MKRSLRNFICISMIALLGLSACSKPTNKEDGTTSKGFDTNNEITVVSREDGSGTRGAFVELTGVEVKDSNGNKVDQTTLEAIIAKATDVMLSTVASDEYSIGYVSLGSLSDKVKAIAVNGAEATVANIKNGSYEIARPFNIAYQENLSEAAQDFLNFILSSEGQEVVEQAKYIKLDDTTPFHSNNASGKVTLGGSSSVSPAIEKLKEAYASYNPNVTIEINTSDSSSGMKEAIEGVCDLGMASRELKDSELAKLSVNVIATDGIAIIVNPANEVSSLSKEQISSIFTGETTTWSEIQ